MKLHKGFILMEVIISLVIAPMLALLLFQSIGSMSKTYQKIFSVSSVQRRFTLLQQQFERDFSGIIAPEINLEDERDSDQKEISDEDQKEDKKKKAEVKTDADKEKKTRTYRVPHVFFSKNDNKGNCIQLTCLTTNPVGMYGQQTPRLVRVVYSFESDPEHEGLFLLARQQSDILDFKEFSKQGPKAIRKFTISDGIETFKVSYLIPKKEDKESKILTEEEKKRIEEDKKKRKKKVKEFVTVTDWPYFEDDSEEKKSERPSYPAFIKIELTLIDDQKRPSDFILWYAPLYDSESIFVDKAATLPSMSDLYHRRFMEQRQKDMLTMQHAMRNSHG